MDVSGLDLSKGRVVTNQTIQRLTGVRQDDPAFWRAKFKVQRMIEKRFKSEDRVCTLRILSDGVHVLTDPEAVKHNKRLNRQARKKINKAFVQVSAVDVTKLDEVERAGYEAVKCALRNDYRALRDVRDPYSLLNQPGG